MSPVVQAGYVALINQLFEIPLGDEPIYLSLTPQAQEYFITWHDDHNAEGEIRSLSPYIRGAYAKLKGYSARLALIHALAKNPQATKENKGSVLCH